MIRHLRFALLLALAALPLGAQAYNYPSLQLPVLAQREYNFAGATAGNAGTSLYVQWRESAQPAWQFSLEGGLATPKQGNTRVLLGGGLAWQALRSQEELPFDIALTIGAGLSSGSGANVVRIPVGAVVGHTFALDGGFSITPFVPITVKRPREEQRAATSMMSSRMNGSPPVRMTRQPGLLSAIESAMRKHCSVVSSFSPILRRTASM